jgi:elongator complex protein 3
MQKYQDGSWRPYTHEELLYVLTEAFKQTPEYCRLTRVIRDIPSTDIVVGNQLTNFRQIVDDSLAKQNLRSPEIRAREIKQQQIKLDDLRLDTVGYASSCSDEIFLQYITEDRLIAGFLRLSLPFKDLPPLHDDLYAAAIIREVHVYGQSLGIGENSDGKAQHAGLGKLLIERAVEISQERGYANLAVISAIGTREYYRKRGFQDKTLYQVRKLTLER